MLASLDNRKQATSPDEGISEWHVDSRLSVALRSNQKSPLQVLEFHYFPLSHEKPSKSMNLPVIIT